MPSRATGGQNAQGHPATLLRSESPEPLYQQVRHALGSWIRDGKLRPNDKIPSERQLCEHFGVSRMTIRQALARLKAEGVIYTRPGKGMFVAEIPPGLELTFVLTGYSEETTPVHGALSNTIIDARLIQATPELTKALRLSVPEEVVRVERLRSLRGAPIALQTIHIPHRLCPGYLSHDLNAKVSLEIIQDEYDLSPVNIEQVIRAGLSGPRETQYLKLTQSTPVLILERKAFLETGEVVEMSESAYLADCFQLLLTLDLSRWSFRVGGDGKYQGQDEERRP